MRRHHTFNTGPTTYHLEISMAHPNVISAGDPGRILELAAYLDHEPRSPEIVDSRRRFITVHGTYKGIPITAFSTGIGTASVSATMPEVIEACDQDDMVFIRLGTSGGLQQYLNVGDFIASTWYQRAETTCDKVMGSGYRAEVDADVRESLVNAARGVRLSFQQICVGPTRVTDEIYFDGEESRKRNHGDVLAVSMEGSAQCAYRDHYNTRHGFRIRVGELLVVSDNVKAEHKEQLSPVAFQKRSSEIQDALIRAGLEALVDLRAQQQG